MPFILVEDITKFVEDCNNPEMLNDIIKGLTKVIMSASHRYRELMEKTQCEHFKDFKCEKTGAAINHERAIEFCKNGYVEKSFLFRILEYISEAINRILSHLPERIIESAMAMP